MTGPDLDEKHEPWTDEDYPGSEGKFVPGSKWSDGVDRIIFDSNKIPARYQFNPAIIEVPGKETDDELDARYINYFNRPDIDGWELRRALILLHVSSPNYLFVVCSFVNIDLLLNAM